MTINEHLTTFAGLPVVSVDDGPGAHRPDAVAWRVEVEDLVDRPQAFEAAMETVLAAAGAGGPVALVIGQWGAAWEQPPPIDLLVRLAPRLSRLRALFLGDLTYEEAEISWINQADVTPLLAAYPLLERLGVRGAQDLAIGGPHESLRDLEIQSGGLPRSVLASIAGMRLPALERLDLWLGVDSYGADHTIDDLAPFLDDAGRWPRLTALGLRDSEMQDEIAAAVAAAPIVPRLRALDLSLGTLGDAGAEALLAGQSLTHLDVLDLHHHYMSPAVAQRLVDALPSVRVDVGDAQRAGSSGDRYPAVME